MKPEKISNSILTVKTDIPLSDKLEDPSVIDPVKQINLVFNQDLNVNTLSDGIKLYKVGSNTSELLEDVTINLEDDSLSVVNISKSDNSKFDEGEEYKLSVSSDVKSSNGTSLKKDYANYFAVDYSFNLDSKGIAELDNKRTLIICISDIHLGVDDSYSENIKNRDALVNFLNHVRLSPNVKELVIAGDLIDEWFVPMHLDTFNGKTQLDFVKSVASNNKSVIDAFNQIIDDGFVKVTYIPGNHDILLNSEDIQSIMPGISQARDVRGLGAYTPTDLTELIIEHGHRYNFYCAPDHSNRSVTQTDSILPPGYFFTRMATSSVIQGRPKMNFILPPVKMNELGRDQYLYFLYWNVWKELITLFPVNEGLEKKVINTGIDGFTDFYAIKDILPYQNSDDGFIDVTLHKGIIESWDNRQNINLVQVNIPTDEAVTAGTIASELDKQSTVQYFNNPASDKKVVIFGHSHEARVITSFSEENEKNIYVNSGTWIDHNNCTMTFVVVVPPKNQDSLSFVNLYQYSLDGDIKKLESQAITNLKYDI